MKNRTKPMQYSEVRIISGRWRGRKIRFPCLPGLRPTPDRVRETVFNWLAPYIVGARCLDLFAGSGALGFEALSRGATAVVWVEQSLQVVAELRNNLHTLMKASDVLETEHTETHHIKMSNEIGRESLSTEQHQQKRIAELHSPSISLEFPHAKIITEVQQATFSQNLHLNTRPFDIVFLDPPFNQNLLPACYEWLQAERLLAPSALIYIESEKQLEELSLPKTWQAIRDKKAGHVYYYLVQGDVNTS